MKTKLVDLIDPEVLSDLIEERINGNSTFLPLAKENRELVGVAGSTITVPTLVIDGSAAAIVAEYGTIPTKKLTSKTVSVQVKKAGEGVSVSDEVLNSALGDPLNNAANQISDAIGTRISLDILEDLLATENVIEGDLTLSTLDKAVGSFKDNYFDPKVIIINEEDYDTVRALVTDDFNRPTPLTDDVIINGSRDMLFGAQIVVDRNVEVGTILVAKPEAVTIYVKEGLSIELDRKADSASTTIYGTKHYATHLSNPSKVVKIDIGL